MQSLDGGYEPSPRATLERSSTNALTGTAVVPPRLAPQLLQELSHHPERKT